MQEPALEIYRQGLSVLQIEALSGIGKSTIQRWTKEAGISRSLSEVKQGESNPSWKGDRVGYFGAHTRAIKDIPNIEDFQCIPCLLLKGISRKAKYRARIDHSNLPYRVDYVMPMCHSCNIKHDLYRKGEKITGGFVILFQEES